MTIPTLPPWQFPLIASSLRAVKEFYDWLKAIDTAVRSGTAAINVRTASYTPVIQDAGGIVEMNVAMANNFTVPPSTSVPFPVGTRMQIPQVGAGQTTLVPGSGVTIDTRVGLKITAQWGVAFLYKRATDEWVASGDLSA